VWCRKSTGLGPLFRPAQDVAAGVGRSAHRLFGCADAGERDRVVEVDSDLEHLGFGVEHRDEAGDEILGGEKPPALPQMQPVASADVVAQVSAGGVIGKLEERVCLLQYRAIVGRQAHIDHQVASDPRHIGAAVQKRIECLFGATSTF
jgi:hypothetical protein